jgi:hypothetical protein
VDRPRLTDELILDLIHRGEVQVFVLPDGSIEVRKRDYGRFQNGAYRVLKQYSDDPGRLCLKLRVNGLPLRKIFRNRLVWMWANNQTIPPGYVVDHEDCDSLNDHPDNLKLMPKAESDRQGNAIQHWTDVAGFFDYIAFVGHAPSEEYWP